MYLSKIKLNTKKRNTVKFLGSLQVAHAAIEAAFADDDDTRKLWRLDYYQGQPCVLLLSINKPALSGFIEQFGDLSDPEEIRDYQKILDMIETGGVYRFRLCANPVHSIKQAAATRGKVLAHVTTAQQEEWLQNKSTQLGFSLLQAAVVQREIKRFKRQVKYVTISMATYEGILKIEDAEVFREILVKGIGRGKSYGCGLLTLARL